ncbi:MAG: hypothetical protein ACREEB_11410 [Caulobacteraceae bacterium]
MALEKATAAAMSARQRRGAFLADVATAKAELATIEGRSRDADTRALLDGGEVVEPDAASRRAARRLGAKAAAAPAAIAKLQAEVDRAEAIQADAAKAVHRAAATMVLSRKDRARAVLQSQLADLGPTLSEMCALDRLYLEKIGPDHAAASGPDAANLWAASAVVSRLINAIVPRIRPPGLEAAEIARAANARLSTLVTELQGAIT